MEKDHGASANPSAREIKRRKKVTESPRVCQFRYVTATAEPGDERISQDGSLGQRQPIVGDVVPDRGGD
jgi:hypothetical protein